MMRNNDKAVMKAVAVCYKPYLKLQEAMICCSLGRSQLSNKCEEHGIFKNNNGYYKMEDLYLILSVAPGKYEEVVKKIRL